MAKKRTLEQEVERLKAVYEVANLMNKYEWLLPGCQFDKVVDLFANKTPGVRAEIGSWGVYEGPEGIKKLFGPGGFHEFLQGTAENPKPGLMVAQTNTTPVIEVAEDCQTAQGVWLCPGYGAGVDPDGNVQATWGTCKRAADFIKEDGEWKIWHYHVYGVYMIPFGTSWADLEDPYELERHKEELPDAIKPDRPTTHPLWHYSKTATVDYTPPSPEPYETFDEKMAC